MTAPQPLVRMASEMSQSHRETSLCPKTVTDNSNWCHGLCANCRLNTEAKLELKIAALLLHTKKRTKLENKNKLDRLVGRTHRHG